MQSDWIGACSRHGSVKVETVGTVLMIAMFRSRYIHSTAKHFLTAALRSLSL